MSIPDCPICLEAMDTSEELLTLPCQTCDYNFCTNCIESFVRCSKDDYQIASDGSRQVKVSIACPQCRSKYPMALSDVLLLRRAHSLGNSIYDASGDRLPDSDLSATQLAQKRDFYSLARKRELELAHGLYLHVMGAKVPRDLIETTKIKWKPLFEGLPENDQEGTGGSEKKNDEKGPISPKADGKLEIDDTLFQGLEDCIGKDERVFLTQLLTSGEVHKLAQASMIIQGILKLSLTNPSMLKQPTFEENSQKKADKIAKTKLAFPLPNHMPGYFSMQPFSPKERHLILDDMTWDGTIIPPQRSKRVFDKVYMNHYHKPMRPRGAVYIKGIRGPAGRLGLRKHDLVTHVNDIEWQGSAQELRDYFQQLYEKHPTEEITLTVNANPETAAFLQVRYKMMEQSERKRT